VAGVIWVLLELVGLAQEVEFALVGSESTLHDVLAGLCEFVPIVLVWLAFYPPSGYRDWIERHTLAPAAG